ncbi:MAG: heavy metal translocating P-type ATPase, partial [Niallia sp.]
MEEEKQLLKKEFTLEGLDCANCAMKIENGIASISGVRECNVNFATQTLSLQLNENERDNILTKAEKTITRLEPHVKMVEKGKRMKNSTPHHHAHGHHHEHDDETHSHTHDHGAENTKKLIGRLAVGTIVAAVGFIAPLTGIMEFVLFFLAYLIVGGDILYRAIKNILRGQVFDEHFLMAIATLGAFAIQEYPEGVAVMLFYQIGELFQGIAVNRSRKSITSLMDIRPDYANVKDGGQYKKISPEQVKIGDIIFVKPGEKIPLDGRVIEGSSSVDTSALTGESIPRDIEIGNEVLSGFINNHGVLTIEVTKDFGDSTVTKILELVQNASSKKA